MDGEPNRSGARSGGVIGESARTSRFGGVIGVMTGVGVTMSRDADRGSIASMIWHLCLWSRVFQDVKENSNDQELQSFSTQCASSVKATKDLQ